VETAGGRLAFTPTAAFGELAGDGEALPIGRPQAQSSNTIVQVDEHLLVKGFRRLREGLNPDVEIGRYLTEVARFPHVAPLAGTLDYTRKDGVTMTLALVQGYVSNQGDGWGYTLAYLQRHLESRLNVPEPEAPDVHAAYLELLGTLGRRTAELHRALALPTSDPAFAPVPLTEADVAEDQRRVLADIDHTFGLLRARMPQLPPASAAIARALVEQGDALRAVVERPLAPGRALKTRFHGDYHLGQVLVTKNDFVIIDFEGEPGRTLEERREKRSPLRDVAGMLRSFGYAASSAVRAASALEGESEATRAAARRWQQQARRAFLAGYHGTEGEAALRDTLAAGADLLTVYEIEKALYELRYELNNRPDWVEIPLGGLLDLAAAASPATGAHDGDR
jgi:maltose alpha-D-glucosyltransferase/alpha-amylase